MAQERGYDLVHVAIVARWGRAARPSYDRGMKLSRDAILHLVADVVVLVLAGLLALKNVGVGAAWLVTAIATLQFAAKFLPSAGPLFTSAKLARWAGDVVNGALALAIWQSSLHPGAAWVIVATAVLKAAVKLLPSDPTPDAPAA